MRNWLKHFSVLVAFAGHVLSAIFIFCLVGVAVVALHLIGAKLTELGVATEILRGIHVLEMAMFFCDLVATLVWAIKSTVAMVVTIMKDKEDKD